jgi:YggT family protein
MGWRLLLLTIQVFQLLILVRVVLSWVASPVSRNPFVEGVRRATDPVINPIRSILPSAGGLDFSPMVALLILSFLRNIVLNAMPY